MFLGELYISLSRRHVSEEKGFKKLGISTKNSAAAFFIIKQLLFGEKSDQSKVVRANSCLYTWPFLGLVTLAVARRLLFFYHHHAGFFPP